jgi:hypothetical protein
VTPPQNEEPVGDDRDLGEPIAELRDLALTVDEGFGRRIRGRIERRVLAGDAVGLAWTASMLMVLEFLRAPFEVLAGRRRT